MCQFPSSGVRKSVCRPSLTEAAAVQSSQGVKKPEGRSLTSSSSSRDEDSFCKTAMSRREDHVSCIDVTIMDRFAHSALPSSYSKIFPAFGAGAAVTPAAGLGGKRFIDFCKPHACVIALIQPTAREVDLSASIANRSDLKGDPAEGAACTATPAPGEADFSMLSAPPRVFFRNLLHRSDGKMQCTVTARGPFEIRPEIKPREKPPLALEHFDRQFVAIIEYCGDLAGQAAKPRGVLVLHPQAQDPNSAGRMAAGHPYSLPKSPPIAPRQTSRNAGRERHASFGVSLSLAVPKSGVSRGEI
jgi:hypothetical protein